MKKKYYAHRSLGFVKDYFGYIGPRVEVSRIRHWVMKVLGYKVSIDESRVPGGYWD